MPVLLINMDPIEFFEIPNEYEIELEFRSNRPTMICRCRCEISHNNTVVEIYDSYDNLIATRIGDFLELGVVKATVIARHEVDLSEVL